MDKEYRYFKDLSGTINRIHLEQDNEPLNPRYDWDGNIGHMMCWWNRYNLGDYKENNYSDPESFLNDLVRHNIPEKQIINFVKTKKTSNGLELRYNRSEKVWELWGYYYWFPLGNSKEAKFAVIASYDSLEWLVDDIIDSMNTPDKWKLLEKNGYVYLNIHCYEHSGITISCSNGYPYNDRWDGGQCGWIYTTKKEVIGCGGMIRGKSGKYIKVTDKNWKQAAYLWMKGEVEIYDQYLQGDVYGYICDELDADDQASLESPMGELFDEEGLTWNEDVDSCWGFYSREWGNSLFEYIMENGIGNYKLYDSVKEVVAA